MIEIEQRKNLMHESWTKFNKNTREKYTHTQSDDKAFIWSLTKNRVVTALSFTVSLLETAPMLGHDRQ